MTENFVWQFTNQKKLNKKEFENYFEKKIFRTIRKYAMLPKNRIIELEKSNDLNTKVLMNVLKIKFVVELSDKPNLSSENLSQIAEGIFKNILKGRFSSQRNNAPLCFHSDKEIELYAKLKNIEGTKRKKDEKIRLLFDKFIEKNPDLEINIVKAMGQIS